MLYFENSVNKIEFHTYRNADETTHISSNLEILYCMSEQANLILGKQQTLLKRGCLYAVMPYEFFDIRLQGGDTVLALRISQDIFRDAMQSRETDCVLPFELTGGIDSDNKSNLVNQEALRLFAETFRVYCSEGPGNSLLLKSKTFELLHNLLFYHAVSPGDKHYVSHLNERLLAAIHYISEWYQTPLTLSSVAKNCFTNPSYLSTLFHKELNIKFSDFLTSIRLGHAISELNTTTHSVTRIALDNGFPNTNSFIQSYKMALGDTPGRKRMLQSSNQQNPQTNAFLLDELLEMVPARPVHEVPPARLLKGPSINTEVDVRKKGKPLRHTWKNLICIGLASDILTTVVQQELYRLQEGIGFQYIRFHGIFDDNLSVYRETANGKSIINFASVDMILDFLLSVDLRPYIEFGMMPLALAEVPRRHMITNEVISLPKDWEKWSLLVTAFLKHCIQRYGLDEIRKWKFSPMQSIFSINNWSFTFQQYLKMYEVTYHAVKSIDNRFSYGGCGSDITLLCEETDVLLPDFLRFCERNDCIPDFLNLQFLTQDFNRKTEHFHDLIASIDTASLPVSKDPQMFERVLKCLRHRLSNFGYDSLPVWIEAWNSSSWQRDLSGDTCFRSAYIAKTLIENYDKVDSMGYWSANDFIETAFSGEASIYYGGYGLFTYNGIPKSSYYTMMLLGRVGSECLHRGNSCFVTRKGASYQIFLYHYVHFSPIFEYSDYQRDSKEKVSRYGYFVQEPPQTHTLRLTGLPASKYKIEQYEINCEYGSSYDQWVRMGAPADMTHEQIRYLIETSQPRYRIEYQTSTDLLSLQCEVPSHGITCFFIEAVAE